MKKVAIVGSRNGHAPGTQERVRAFVERLAESGEVEAIVSGGAAGIDRWAAQAARDFGLEVIEFLPDWSQGKGAGFERNTKIVVEADVVVAFWNGVSRGTMDSVRKAERMGKKVKVIRTDFCPSPRPPRYPPPLNGQLPRSRTRGLVE